jgi:hypothetical protein
MSYFGGQVCNKARHPISTITKDFISMQYNLLRHTKPYNRKTHGIRNDISEIIPTGTVLACHHTRYFLWRYQGLVVRIMHINSGFGWWWRRWR